MSSWFEVFWWFCICIYIFRFLRGGESFCGQGYKIWKQSNTLAHERCYCPFQSLSGQRPRKSQCKLQVNSLKKTPKVSLFWSGSITLRRSKQPYMKKLISLVSPVATMLHIENVVIMEHQTLPTPVIGTSSPWSEKGTHNVEKFSRSFTLCEAMLGWSMLRFQNCCNFGLLGKIYLFQVFGYHSQIEAKSSWGRRKAWLKELSGLLKGNFSTNGAGTLISYGIRRISSP